MKYNYVLFIFLWLQSIPVFAHSEAFSENVLMHLGLHGLESGIALLLLIAVGDLVFRLLQNIKG